jgi:hypothetical protein
MSKFDWQAISVPASILLTFVGWRVTHWKDRELAKHKDQLELVNKRLNEFYGPLYVASEAGETAYNSLLEKIGAKEDRYGAGKTLTEDELTEWLVWMENVMMPLNEIRERLIIDRAYLIREREMPDCLTEFVKHVVGFRAVLAKWKKGNFTELYSFRIYPRELQEYARRSYRELKEEQARLIGITQGRGDLLPQEQKSAGD